MEVQSISKGRCCWSAHLDLHGGGGQSCDLFLHAVSDAGVHGGTSRQHGVGVQVLTDVNVTLHDAVVGGLMDATGLHTWDTKQQSDTEEMAAR